MSTYTGKKNNQFDLSKPKEQRKKQTKGKKTKKYEYSNKKKGKDKTLNMEYLEKKFLPRDKMELKLSTFKDTSVNDKREVDVDIVGDTVTFDNTLMRPYSLGSRYQAITAGYGTATEDVGFMLIQYGKQLTDTYNAVNGSYPAGSFAFQMQSDIQKNLDVDWLDADVEPSENNASNIIDGNSVTLKRSIYNLTISMDAMSYKDIEDPELDGIQPTDFRVLHLVPKRKVAEDGNDEDNALNRLWLLPTGLQGGLAVPENCSNNPPMATEYGYSSQQAFNMPIDKSYWYVKSDQKFTLQNPAESRVQSGEIQPDQNFVINQATINNKFPVKRDLVFVDNYAVETKMRGDNKTQLIGRYLNYVSSPSATGIRYHFSEPKDLNFRDLIIILCKKSTGRISTGSSLLWSAGGYGSLSAYDV